MIIYGIRNFSLFLDYIYCIKKGMERKFRIKGDFIFLVCYSIVMYFVKVKFFYIFKVFFYVVYLKRYWMESI